MPFPAITAFYAGLLGIVFVILSVWVTVGRAQFKAHHGDGGHVQLQRRIRIQANFAEYVPLALLLIGLDETGGFERRTIRCLLVALLIARVMHPLGMIAPEGSIQQYALRAPAMIATWTVIAVASAMLVLR